MLQAAVISSVTDASSTSKAFKKASWKLVLPTVGATAMATPFRRWTTCRARKEKTNSTLALAQASEPRVSLLFSPPGPSMV